MRKLLRAQRGQALTEMVLAVPLLFLFVAGLIQFAVLFLSYVQFEHACGEAARTFAAGQIDKNALDSKIIENLGSYKKFFDTHSLEVKPQSPRGGFAGLLEKIRGTLSIIPFTLNYSGVEWWIQIKFLPPFLVQTLFPDGIPFRTTMQVYRFPQ